MSMLLMVKAMQLKVGNPLRKLVLLKLADQANDQGECWPSYQHIAEHCETTRRSVMIHVKALEDENLLRREYRKGEKGNSSNIFHLTLGKRPSEADSPPSEGDSPHGEGDSLPLVKEIHPESVSFEPVNEPVKNNIKKSALDFSVWPSLPSNQVLNDWIAVRKAKRAPLTQTAVNLMSAELHQAARNGLSVDHCISLCAARAWVSFKFEWAVNAGATTPPTENWANNVFDAEDPLT